ncbi:hypothetical protein VOLCADRAFT_120350 [Volvox carteri f. nagariensis]|uniref:Uncharacterized protein n=1 Tax=Volvox carteri f. nagariensis TaxID=3068 RepID=D8TKR7_VOLCA|nr:uncharacterized protein VOLCADRAFT_120350 [Volvox carteri f. nagariensis]EFJ52110.1 hypothetical protein VOLCADRAFT_120350 [Volvox carteri f. nagariensis]|eukprot:XP_002946884.1 hypothetical protein VOLCADRAFT_120350 [Volvox carteri f. nagariensis]
MLRCHGHLRQSDAHAEALLGAPEPEGGKAKMFTKIVCVIYHRYGDKESHGSPVVDLVFNGLDPEHRNLFASIGKDQVTIYDDEHMGDFLGVVVQYVNSPSTHHRGGDVTCCAWVQMSGLTGHELGDACLAVSGPEGVIQVISVVEGRVISLLKGHRGEVVELRGCAGVPGLLVSLGLDGGLRLWDVAEGTCLAEMASDAACLEVHAEGSCFFTGHRGGRICRWDLNLHADQNRNLDPDPPTHADRDDPNGPSPAAAYRDAATGGDAAAAADGGGAAAPSGVAVVPCGGAPGAHVRRPLALRGHPPAPQQLALPGNPLGELVECLRCMPGGRLAAKSSDGRLAVWDLGRGVQLLSLRVPGTHSAAVAGGGGGAGLGAAAALRSGRCRFSVTRDGDFICVGNPAGDVYVYDTASGTRAAHYSAQKARGPARAAALSEDGRHLLTVHGNGYILRRWSTLREQSVSLAGGDLTNLLFVDDVSLVATGHDRAECLLGLLEAYCNATGMAANAAKCEVLIFGGATRERKRLVEAEYRYEYIRKLQEQKKLRDRTAAAAATASATPEPEDVVQTGGEAGEDGGADGGAADSSREVSPDTFTEDDTGAAAAAAAALVGPGMGTCTGGPGGAGRALAAAKRPRSTEGDAMGTGGSGSGGGTGSGSGDDGSTADGSSGGGGVGRRLKLRVRLGPRVGNNGAVAESGTEAATAAAAAAAVAASLRSSFAERETSPDAECSPGVLV